MAFEKKLWSVENGANTVVAVGVDSDGTSALEIGTKHLTDEAIDGFEKVGTGLSGTDADVGKVLAYKGGTEDKKVEWIAKSDIVSASSEKQSSVTTTLGSITVAGSTFNIPDSVVANPDPISATAANLTGLKVAGTDYKIAPVEANPTEETTDELTAIKIDNTSYKIKGLPDGTTAGQALVYDGENWIKQDGYSYKISDGKLYYSTEESPYSVEFNRLDDYPSYKFTYYKVSDDTPSKEEILKGFTALCYTSYTSLSTEITSDNTSTISDDSGNEIGWKFTATLTDSRSNSYKCIVMNISQNCIYTSQYLNKGMYVYFSMKDWINNNGIIISSNDNTPNVVFNDNNKFKEINIHFYTDYNFTLYKMMYVSDSFIAYNDIIGGRITVQDLFKNDNQYTVVEDISATYPEGFDLKGMTGFKIHQKWETYNAYKIIVITNPASEESGQSNYPLFLQSGIYLTYGQVYSTYYGSSILSVNTQYSKINSQLIPPPAENIKVGYSGNGSFTLYSGDTEKSILFSSATDANDTVFIYPSSRAYKTIFEDKDIYLSSTYDSTNGCIKVTFSLAEAVTSQYQIGYVYSIVKLDKDPNSN